MPLAKDSKARSLLKQLYSRLDAIANSSGPFLFVRLEAIASRLEASPIVGYHMYFKSIEW